jgi:hypothetical protein
MLVEKHPKHGTLLFGRFKPRFFFIIGIVVLAILAYLYFTGAFKDWQIQLSYYNNSTVGNGASTVVIPFTILEGTEQPITVPIQVQAITNIGTVATKCSSPSTCNVTFMAPKTAHVEFANISINVGGTNDGETKTVSITVTPDEPKSISVNIANTDLYLSNQNILYTHSGQFLNTTSVVVYALDSYGNPVPDGTLINFNAGAGTLSNSWCTTKGGQCNVTYSPPQKVGQFYVTGYSGNLSSSVIVNITNPPISGYSYGTSNDSLQEIAHSQACGFEYCAYYNYTLNGSLTLTVRVNDALNEPVSDAHISVYPPSQVTPSNCFTNSTGLCNLTLSVSQSGIYDNYCDAETVVGGICYNESTGVYYTGSTEVYNPSATFVIYINQEQFQSIVLDCSNGLACSSAVN